VRYFVSTGEASGELSGVLLAQAIRAHDPQAQFEGIGHQRMHDAGFTIWRDHRGWASMGPLAAIPRIPGLLNAMWQTARHIARTKPDLVILIDFGAFNVRLAKELRTRLHYAGPILDLFPPATWLDNRKRAKEISSYAVPMTAFEHQYEFYKRHDLPIVYFGHPLAAQYPARAPLPAPPARGGRVALLPGSRGGELRYHVPALVQAYRLLKARRPQLHGTFGAADARAEKTLRTIVEREGLKDVTVERGVQAAIAGADAAWVSSGTAVLETTLTGVPVVALYKIAPILVKHARRVYSGRFITLPNLVVGEEIVPELLQDDATPERLAETMEHLLDDPFAQVRHFDRLRRALGPPDALDRCAQFAVSLARTGAA